MKAAPFKFISMALLLLGLAACASGPQRNPEDPLEPFNRSMFAFNEGLDKAVAKPAAQGYQTIAPYPVRMHISNFFNNLQDGWTVVNNALQLRPQAFAESFFRFSFNTFIGMGGFVNVADSMGLARDQQDFGKTLGRYGVPPGPYVVLPVLGASTVRDSAGLVVDLEADLLRHEVQHIPSRNSLYALRPIDKRANLLAAGNILEEAAVDKYAFMRNAYLQKRRSDIDTLRRQKATTEEYYDSLPNDAAPADDAPADTPIDAPQGAHEANRANEASAPVGSAANQTAGYETPAASQTQNTAAAPPSKIKMPRSNYALQAPVARLLNH